MSKDPAFLFYVNDYVGDTLDFSLEQHGAYLKLMLHQFNRGHFSYDSAKKIVGEVFDSIKQLFKVDSEGNFYSSRLDEEKEKRKKHSEHQKNNSLKRWVKKQESIPNECDCISQNNAVAIPLENENENRNEVVFKNEVSSFSLKSPENLSFKKPTVEEISDYCQSRENNVDPDSFFNHYESNGWMVGKAKMKNWQAAVRTWEKNNVANSGKIGFREAGFRGNLGKNPCQRPGYDTNGIAIGAAAKPGEFYEGIITLEGVPDHR